MGHRPIRERQRGHVHQVARQRAAAQRAGQSQRAHRSIGAADSRLLEPGHRDFPDAVVHRRRPANHDPELQLRRHLQLRADEADVQRSQVRAVHELRQPRLSRPAGRDFGDLQFHADRQAACPGRPRRTSCCRPRVPASRRFSFSRPAERRSRRRADSASRSFECNSASSARRAAGARAGRGRSRRVS